MRLDGAIALVSGGARGIGRAVAIRLAQEGATVAILDVDAAAGEEAARAIGAGTLFIRADCTRQAEVDASVDTVVAQLGRIDVLVNNVGWALPTFFIEEHEADWDRLIAVNLKTQLLVTRAALRDMTRRTGGKIVNISSEAGRTGQIQAVVYSLCKAGIIGFTKSLAREVARHRISVNCVCPGPTDTPLFRQAIGPDTTELLARTIPFRRIALPEEIAAAVAFFASPDANFITGQVLSVSGGLTMSG